MKSPIVNFTPFHPSRVESLRNWREKDLREVPRKSTKIKLDKAPREKKSKAPKTFSLPPGLDPATQAMVLEVLKKLRK